MVAYGPIIPLITRATNDVYQRVSNWSPCIHTQGELCVYTQGIHTQGELCVYTQGRPIGYALVDLRALCVYTHKAN